MSTPQSPRAMQTRRSRKSIAHIPPTTVRSENENREPEMSSRNSSIAKKPRSKSLGSGGLGALEEDSGNRQKSLHTIKSILKPAIPLSPLKQILPHPNNRKSSPKKAGSLSPRKRLNNKSIANDSNVADSQKPSTDLTESSFDNRHGQTEATNLNPEDSVVAVRSEEEQYAAAKEREKQEIIDRRDARRKSLANRRVSFAPEATLHTWNVVELAEDATSSSEATDFTRRASNGSTLAGSSFAQAHPEAPNSDNIEAPSTPPEQSEDFQVTASPNGQRGRNQRKRRRSSGIPPMNVNSLDDFSSSPGSSIASEDTASLIVEESINSSDSDEKDLIEAEATMIEGDDDNITMQSVASLLSNSSTNSSGRLEQALRQAAKQAGTQGIEFDEHGDLSMELTVGETLKVSDTISHQQYPQPVDRRQFDPIYDQENVNPFSPAFRSDVVRKIQEANSGEAMDITQAPGVMLSMSSKHQSPSKSGRRKYVPGRRRSDAGRRRSSDNESISVDETMDLTVAVGGIQQIQSIVDEDHQVSLDDEDEDEDLSMEFTSVVGGVVEHHFPDSKLKSQVIGKMVTNQHISLGESGRTSISSILSEEDMDMTMAMGGILPSITERTEPNEDETMAMDVTTAMGNILPEDLRTNDRMVAKQLMEQEAEHGQLTRSMFEKPQQVETAPRITAPVGDSHLVVFASELGSPSVIIAHGHNSAKSEGSRPSVAPQVNINESTPLKGPFTPSKKLTPQPKRPITPSKTPPSKNVTLRSASPKKLFKAEIKKAKSTTPNSAIPVLKFNSSASTGIVAPNIILTPQNSRTSGIGIDKAGLGSPRIAALLDRRASIGENAVFNRQSPAATRIRFEDPYVMEQEVDSERLEDERRESGKGILEIEVDGEYPENNVTANLKDKIESLTPKKKKLNGRKSLHVGAARGLLGKRPAELDEEESDESTPKRLRGPNKSPVKNIRLPPPPSKTETTGRLKNALRSSLGETTANKQISTPKLTKGSLAPQTAASPNHQGRFRDAELIASAGKPATTFNEKLAGMSSVKEPTKDEEGMHLQGFLNMTSIRFMDITTTKRRHTVAPGVDHDDTISGIASHDGDKHDNSSALAARVVAAACTVPMLELYEHSCRELKTYISEGRDIVREIETDTYEDNPPLFREYMSAPPDVRAIMDNQFKNIKTHARLLSKAMWYEWRMKLLDGLKEGLVQIEGGFNKDDEVLAKQEQLLDSVVPGLVAEHEKLLNEKQRIQAQAEELASYDKEELAIARERLRTANAELDMKTTMVSSLQRQVKQQEQQIVREFKKREDCEAEIKEAEKVQKECRGWTRREVAALKARVDAIEDAHGWRYVSISGVSLTLQYRRALQLVISLLSFCKNGRPNTAKSAGNGPISLAYVADVDQDDPIPLTTEKRFFLQIMQARLQCLPQNQTEIGAVMTLVSDGWEQACQVAEERRRLGLIYVTESVIRSDEHWAVVAAIFLRATKTKVSVEFNVRVGGEGPTITRGLEIQAKVHYGKPLNEAKMVEFLRSRIDKGKGQVEWVGALRELDLKLIAKGN